MNHGVSQAAKWLQAAVGAAQDGSIGPLTLNAVAKANSAALAMLYLSARLFFYPKLSTWPTFGKGWANRVAGNLQLAAQDIGA